MKRGLLLAAFVVTLVLDMGAGPVFIVYASLNLSKNASFPAATWLLVRGIFNCIQFLTVMALCYQVNRIKRLYSHKEEHLVVGNLLATHPVSFFYYCIILGGVVWNTLGSGWITTAFRDYNRGFGICYLVCIILSWISVIISPTFVFCGGLVYKRKVIEEPPKDDGGILDSLLSSDDGVFDVKKVIAQFQQEGVSLSVDDILWRDRFIQQENQPKEVFTPHSMDDPLPVVVTDITVGDTASSSAHEVSLEDLRNDLHRTFEEGVTRIISDVLDEESIRVSQEEEQVLQELLQQQKVVVLEEPVITNELVPTTPSSVVTAVSTAVLPHAVEVVETPRVETPRVESPREPVQKSVSKKEKRKKYSRRNQPKECVVSVDSVLSSVSPQSFVMNEGSVQVNERYSREFIDGSQQMIQQINDGVFSKEPINENVSVTYL